MKLLKTFLSKPISLIANLSFETNAFPETLSQANATPIFKKDDYTLCNNRSSRRRCSIKIDVLENFAKFTGNHLCQVSLANLAGWGLQLYEKRDSGTGAFLWVLRNFQEHLFYRTPLDNCFCDNYRPISLPLNIIKIIEILVHKRLNKFLNLKVILYKAQFGLSP